jgi:hypothetical protein
VQRDHRLGRPGQLISNPFGSADLTMPTVLNVGYRSTNY